MIGCPGAPNLKTNDTPLGVLVATVDGHQWGSGYVFCFDFQARALCLTLAREVGELKAVSLQVVATIIMHSRELQFRSHFYEFLRKRAVRHLDQPKKAYHSLEILRTVVCGGNVVNDRALRFVTCLEIDLFAVNW